MVEFAYVKCGLSIDEFYNLSLYEWSLEVLRVREREKLERERWEGNAFLIREQMALMANLKRSRKHKPDAWKGSDFIRLSFDKEDDEVKSEPRRLTPEEVQAKIDRVNELMSKQKKNG